MIKVSRIFRFEQRIGFPGVLGALDCTLPKIIAPADHEERYLNYKRQHSLNVQVVGISESLIIWIYVNFRFIYLYIDFRL